MPSVTIAGAQFRSGPHSQRNLHAMWNQAEEAKRWNAQMIVFPEASMACFGSTLSDVAEDLDGPFADGVRDMARALGLVVCVGMFTPADGQRVHNTTLVTDGHGQETVYHKMHLFDAFKHHESKVVAPGNALVTFDAFGVRFGLATCYDIRFADQFKALGRAGSQVILLGASWADGPRKLDQWRTLTSARAMDSQCFLVAIDQPLTKSDKNLPLGVGHSVVRHPLGHAVDELGDHPGLMITELDMQDVEDTRAELPLL